MSDVNLVINKRSYRITCDDGQEGRVVALGRRLDAKIAELVGRVGQLAEAQLLVMAALMIADEALDLEARATESEHGVRSRLMTEAESELAAALDDIASRVEALATAVEKQIARLA